MKDERMNCRNMMALLKNWRVWTGLLIAVGTLVRLNEYLDNRSLWWDEASLALNIINRDWLGLTQELDYFQAAPVFFLWVSHAMVNLLGPAEWVLRLFPMLMGLLALGLFPLVAKRFLPPNLIVAGMAMLALSTPHIRYSHEFKQYIVDVVATLIVLWLSQRCKEGHAWPWKALLVFCPLVLWLSHASLFAVSALLLVLLADLLTSRQWAMAKRIFVVGVLTFGSFLFNYVAVLEPTANSRYFNDVWTRDFAPWPTSLDNLGWYWQSTKDLFHSAVGWSEVDLGALLLLGCFVLAAIKRQWKYAYLLGPLLMALIASLLEKYPYTQRFMLYNLPLFILACLSTLDHFGGWLEQKWNQWQGTSRQWKVKALVVNLIWVFLLFTPTMRAYEMLTQPAANEEVRGALEYLSEHWSQGDELVVFGRTGTVFEYYKQTRPELVTEDMVEHHKIFMQVRDFTPAPQGTWILMNHIDPHEHQPMLKYWQREYRFKTHLLLMGAYLYKAHLK